MYIDCLDKRPAEAGITKGIIKVFLKPRQHTVNKYDHEGLSCVCRRLEWSYFFSFPAGT